MKEPGGGGLKQGMLYQKLQRGNQLKFQIFIDDKGLNIAVIGPFSSSVFCCEHRNVETYFLNVMW